MRHTSHTTLKCLFQLPNVTCVELFDSEATYHKTINGANERCLLIKALLQDWKCFANNLEWIIHQKALMKPVIGGHTSTGVWDVMIRAEELEAEAEMAMIETEMDAYGEDFDARLLVAGNKIEGFRRLKVR